MSVKSNSRTIYDLNHQRRRAVTDVRELQKLIFIWNLGLWATAMSPEKSSCSAPHGSTPTAGSALAAVRLCWPGTGLSWAPCTAGASLVPHWWISSIWQQEWHFSTSTSSTTSFIANWFLWGFKRFSQKAAPENKPCHVSSSQQSASGLNLIQWHTPCISNNFEGKKLNNKKCIYVFCVIILQKEQTLETEY